MYRRLWYLKKLERVIIYFFTCVPIKDKLSFILLSYFLLFLSCSKISVFDRSLLFFRIFLRSSIFSLTSSCVQFFSPYVFIIISSRECEVLPLSPLKFWIILDSALLEDFLLFGSLLVSSFSRLISFFLPLCKRYFCFLCFWDEFWFWKLIFLCLFSFDDFF